jgi:hypothetical protein
MLKKKFSEPVFDTELTVAIWTRSELSDLVDQDIEAVYWSFFEDEKVMVINMDEIRTNVLFMKTLVHELLHAVSIKLRTKDIDHTGITEEVYCYLYDFYFWKIYKWLEKQNLIIMKNLPTKKVKK